MKIYIKNEVYFNRKPKVIDDYLDKEHIMFKKDCGMYIVNMEQIFELCNLIIDLINELDVPNIYPFITPIENVLIVTFRQINRDTMCFK